MAYSREPDLIDILQAELARRQDRNPSYSIRSFARSLNLGPTTLSQALVRKRSLSKSSQKRVIAALNLPDTYLQLSEPDELLSDDFELIDESVFRMISSWQYAAVLCLASSSDNRADPQWVASRLNISLKEAEKVLARLMELQFLAEVDGRMKALKSPDLCTPTEVSSAITLTMKPKDIDRAKKMIQAFKRRFCKMIDGSESDNVFTLAIQLFPLKRLRGQENEVSEMDESH